MRIGATGKFLCFAIGAWISCPAATFTVSKDGRGTFSTIQAAVNKAGKGDVIEVLDAAVYPEQVTIDSTKDGLTLISANPTALQKPTITWDDQTDVYPTTAPKRFPAPPAAITFRSKRRLAFAHGPQRDHRRHRNRRRRPNSLLPLGYLGQTERIACNGNLSDLLAGNGALKFLFPRDITIRNCDINNAYFGIALKDRNMGGIFANVNPADLAKLMWFRFRDSANPAGMCLNTTASTTTAGDSFRNPPGIWVPPSATTWYMKTTIPAATELHCGEGESHGQRRPEPTRRRHVCSKT